MIEGYGTVEPVPGAAFRLDRDLQYNVVFDCRSGADGDGDVSPSLDRVARFLNLLEQDGIPPGRALVAAVLRGEATKASLSDEGYQRRFGRPNPNGRLVGLLRERGVDLVVCGQSLAGRGFGLDEVDPRFATAVSAMSALASYQSLGFVLLLE